MANPPAMEPMSPEQSALLAEFARTCKAAARAVSLYPGTHPAIGASLSRLVASTERLARNGPTTVVVHRDALAIDGRSPQRPDSSIGEVASLLHERLIGLLTLERDADAEDWRALLLLLARGPEDLMAAGGIANAWAQTGRSHVDIREIDYAEVLRERGGDEAAWDRIVAFCLQGNAGTLDEGALASLLDALKDPATFGQLLERLQDLPDADGAKAEARIAALLHLMRTAIDAARARSAADGERALQTIAESCARLTPDTMLAMLESRDSPNRHDADTASAVLDRVTSETTASFLARSVTRERGATERLAQALEALVPDAGQRSRVVEMAREEARSGELGAGDGFEQLWQNVTDMVMSYSMMSYSDEPFVSEQYGRELSSARRQAIEVERVSDDPPERVQAWVATISEPALRDLDLQLVLDLLRIEGSEGQWGPMAAVAASEAERRTLAGDVAGAQALIDAIVRESRDGGRPALRPAATKTLARLCTGPLARHVALHFRSIEDADVERFNQLCRAIGPGIVRPLAEALAGEENGAAIRRLGGLLIGFGTAGRRAVEQLKSSSNPAVRRTAITLLRSAGGQEALSELASMLADADPEVQRESIRAILDIGTVNAYAVLHRLLVEADTPRDTALRELMNLRDDKAAPLFSYVLGKSEPRGRLVNVHLSMIEGLGAMTPRPESVHALQQVLHRGRWWAPFRTATMRQAAAAALRRLGTPAAVAALEAAASAGSRAVRKAARAQLAMLPPREKSHT